MCWTSLEETFTFCSTLEMTYLKYHVLRNAFSMRTETAGCKLSCLTNSTIIVGLKWVQTKVHCQINWYVWSTTHKSLSRMTNMNKKSEEFLLPHMKLRIVRCPIEMTGYHLQNFTRPHLHVSIFDQLVSSGNIIHRLCFSHKSKAAILNNHLKFLRLPMVN